MNFSAKLNLIFEELELTNISVAGYGKLDPSLISRFRNAKRTPFYGSQQIHKISSGIVIAAKNENKLSLLSSICAFKEDDPEEIKLKLEAWLNREDSMLKIKKSPSSSVSFNDVSAETYLAFSRKMDLLMDLFNLKNVDLARSLHIDSSLVSRFRTGIRNPNSENWFPPQFCSWVAQEILNFPEELIKKNLSPLIGDSIPYDAKKLNEKLLEWMYHDFKFQDLCLFSEFIERLKDLKAKFQVSQDMLESIEALPIYSRSSEVLIGQEGLKDAVIRFFLLTAMSSKPSTLYLYSNQTMNWLIEDSDFSSIWSLFMYIVLQNKNKICIVHNIDRSFADLEYALNIWMPLYISGRIEAFVEQGDCFSSFCNTIFVIPEICSITASFISGTEDQAKYYFTTSPKDVDYNHQQFKALLSKSEALHKIHRFESPNQYLDYITNLMNGKKLDIEKVSLFLPRDIPTYILESIELIGRFYKLDSLIADLSEDINKDLLVFNFENKLSLVLFLKEDIMVFESDNQFLNQSLNRIYSQFYIKGENFL